MANDTRPSRRSKDDDESTSSRKKGKGSSSSGSPTTESSGLRRSSRETPSRKQLSSSPSTMRKSDRLEKRTPTSTPVKRKSQIGEKQRVSSPLRRSDRGKKNPTLCSLGSKKFEKGSVSSDVKRKKLQREKSVKQLIMEGKESNGRGKQDRKPIGVKKKRMDARTYTSFFKQQLKRYTGPDVDEELKRPDKLAEADSSGCGGSVPKQVEDGEDGGEECNDKMGEQLRDDCTEGACEAGTERFIVNSSEVEKLRTPELVGSTCSGRILDGYINEGTGDRVLPKRTGGRVVSKRKRCAVQMDCETSTAFARDDFVGTCPICSKRRRVDYDSPVQELCHCDIALNKDLRYASSPKDRREPEANVREFVEKNDGTEQHKGSSLDMQIDGHQNICVICKLGGKLLCCAGRGCKRMYHLSCLDPPFDDAPPGDWYCFLCVKKKIELGVYSVSEGVESIWDAREVDVKDTKGLQKQKQYFVKYKGLAHIHNHWVPETQLILHARSLVLKFSRNNQVMKWREQWRTPHRLLKKRLLRYPNQEDDNHSEPPGDVSDCHNEWLVKWRGLDYEHATWELENASFIQSPQALSLIRKYEDRRQRAKNAATVSQLDKNEGSLVKFSKLAPGVLPGIEYNQLSSVNKLRDYWHKGQSAVVIDRQERVMKVILFIQSLVSNVSQPFLIISNSIALSIWEAEFLRLDPSTDVVVYGGSKDNRRIIRSSEFYEEGGCIMFQVLLFPLEALIEDFEVLECIRWEAVIVDECQCTETSKHFEQIKKLSAEFRVLLFNGQLKDSVAEHLNLLSLLEHPSDLDCSGCPETDLDDVLVKLKERLTQFIAYDCKPNASRYLEYWVPVLISNVQLEQYCATLLSNYMSLRSCAKNDPVGALRNILISTRKCCDHPYVVDENLQRFLTKDLPVVEYLNVGIKASGKLQLLDTILSEIQNRGLRVVILFQSIGGSGRDLIGAILEDFIRQRFGPDSYECIDGSYLPAKKKQAVLNKFNDKGSGRFLFLIENRACNSSIKLSSVDSIVIFDSDWNPANDIRALHKISIDSSIEQIKIFRLYSSCTVEEKVLILATHDGTIDSNLQGTSPSTIHSLLMWGASYLFNKLDEFHGCNISVTGANICLEPSLLKDVTDEFLNLLCQHGENTSTNNSLIIKVQHGGGAYSKNVPLLGELKFQLSDGEVPTVFWTKLLEGRKSQGAFPSGPSQRNRKRVQYFGDMQKNSEAETDEVVKKRKKVTSNSADPVSSSLKPTPKETEPRGDRGGSGVPAGCDSQLLPRSTAFVTEALQGNDASISPFPSNDISLLPEVHTVESEEGIGSCHVTESLHVLLKPEISKLCEILEVPEDVKVMVERFLEYVIDNHRINREPASILQAFKISLCWIAASMLKYKIDKKESLSLAKKHLDFGCTEEEVDMVYSKLRLLKKMFLDRVENFKESGRSKDSVSTAEDRVKEMPDAIMSPSIAFGHGNVKVEAEEGSKIQEFSEERLFSQQEQAQTHNLVQAETSKSIEHIQRKCEKNMAKLIRKQKEEVQEFIKIWEGKKVQLEKKYRLESALVCTIHSNISKRVDELGKVDNEFAKKREEHKRQKEICRKDIEAKQFAERNAARQDAVRLLKEVKSSVQTGLSVELPPNVSEGDCASEQVGCGVIIETPTTPLGTNQETGVGVSVTLQRAEVAGFEPLSNLHSSADASENNVFVKPRSSREKILVVAPSSAQEVPGSALNKLVGASETVEIVILDSDSNRECNQRNAIDVSIRDATTNVNDRAGSSIIGDDSGSAEQSFVEAHLVQPVITPAQASMLSHNSALRDVHFQSSASSGMHDIDAPAGVNQNALQQVEVTPLIPTDPVPGDRSSHEALVVEQAEQLQPSPSTDSLVDRSRLISGLAAGVGQVEVTPLIPIDGRPGDQSKHDALVIEQAEQLQLSPSTDSLVDQSRLISGSPAGVGQPYSEQLFSFSNTGDVPGENRATPPLICATEVPFSLNQSDLGVSNDNQPSNEGCIPNQNAEAWSQLVENIAGLPNQNFPAAHMEVDTPVDSLGGSGTHILLHSARQAISRMPTQPLHEDPLQIELERLRKEMDQTIKAYEDTKLRLKSDCEKEIEEIIAELRQKYGAKLKDAEAAFLLKKKELDTNHHKVHMNKILAEAFRAKCEDRKTSVASRMQQVVPSNFMQQFHPRPDLATTSSSPVVSASASQQTAAPPPPMQVPHHSLAHFSSMQTRPPLIVPITPTSGNLQTVGEIRSPAPHLQPFRPSSSMAATIIPSLPRGSPSLNLPITSPSVLLGPFQPALPPPSPPLMPPSLPLPTLPTHHSGHQPAITGGGLSSFQNSSLSALGLLVHLNNQPGAHPPNILPPLPDMSSNFGSLDLSEFGAPSSGRGSGRLNWASSDVATNVVYLSDDD